MSRPPSTALSEAEQFAAPGDVEALAEFCRSLDLLTDRWPALLDQVSEPNWQEGLLRIAQYLICRHWFQAVSDWDLSSRVKLAVSACALLSRLPGPLAGSAQLWSKEIENSAENLNAWLDAAYTEPALTDANLLGLLA